MIYKILYYDRINVSEGIDHNMSSASKECIICYYLYFLNKGLDQATVCNRCQDVPVMPIEINCIVILNTHDIDYRCIIVGIRKAEAIK